MVDTDKAFIANKIRLARKKVRLTQLALAKELGITPAHVSRIEAGVYVPSVQTFLKMVQVLQLDLKEFGIESTDNKNPVREEILKIIDAADDKELNLYLNCLKTISENLKSIKK